MPIAINHDTGEAMALSPDGQWLPARTAVNPETKEMLAYDGSSWVAVPQSKSILRYVDDAVRAAAQGATFGWADPLAARASAALGYGTYEENLARERAQTAAIPTALRVPAEIAGGIGSAVATAPFTAGAAALTGASRLPWLVRAAGAGALGGGVYGAGEAAPGERVPGALEGAGVGAALGPLAAGAGRLASGIYQGVRGAFAPTSAATQDVVRALSRDVSSPEGAAEVAQRAATAAGVRPGVATLADVGGENVRGLAERVAQTPGAGRTIAVPRLSERQVAQRGRLAADLTDLTETKQSAIEAIDQTIAERSAAARPLYDSAMDFRAETVPEITDVWRDVTRTGFGRAVTMSPNYRRLIQTEYGVQDPSQAPLMIQLDSWKKSVDDVINAAQRAGEGNKVRVLTAMRDRLLETVDEANPAYARARAAWSGPSQYLDAIDAGKAMWSPKVSAEEVTRQLARMSESEQEGFRIGAVSAIKTRMGGDAAKLSDATKFLRSPSAREKTAAILPTDEARARWDQILRFEIGSSEVSARALGGSPTARRLAEKAEVEGLAYDLLMHAFSGAPPVSWLRSMLGYIPKKVRDTARSRTDKELARMLFDPRFNARDLLNRAETYTPPSPALPAFIGAGVLGPATSEQFGGVQ
jgi:hypothetical protein